MKIKSINFLQCNPSWLDGVLHVFKHLELLRDQDAEVVRIVTPAFTRGAYYAHSFFILTRFPCSF